MCKARCLCLLIPSLLVRAATCRAIYGRRRDLVTPETPQQTRAAQYRVAASILVIALSIVLAWVNPDVAKYCWLLLAVAPRVADGWASRQAA